MSNPYQSPESGSSSFSKGSMVACRGCGKEIHITAAHCPSCGASQRNRSYKSKNLAAVMALLIGGFGVHRFYLGQWWGIVYLLFFWTWIPGIISIIECIVFFATDQRNWDEKFNEGKPAAPGEGAGAGAVALVIVGVVFAISVVGILAAIAIPAYQDYTVRAKVAAALTESSHVKHAASEYIIQNDMHPLNNQSLNLSQPLYLSEGHEVEVFAGGIELKLAGMPLLEEKSIILTPVRNQNLIEWDCRGGTLEKKFRPRVCQ